MAVLKYVRTASRLGARFTTLEEDADKGPGVKWARNLGTAATARVA